MAANLQPISSDGGFTSGGNINLNGNLNLPLNSVVYETNIPDGALSGSAIALKPAGGTSNNQQLLIYPTAADGDHVHLTSGNLYATELFLGSDNLYVKLANTGNVVINSNDGNSNTAMWTFDTTGNLTLPGNTFAVNYANGTQVSIGGGSGNTGNVTFDDNIVIGTGDEFGSTGLFLAPGNGSIANSALQYLRVRGGDAPTHIHLDTGNNQFYDQYFGNDAKYVKLEAGDAGNVVIGTDDANGNLYTWSFTSDGNLILAGGDSVIQSIANSSLDPLIPNVSTMVFTPDAGYSSQALVLDPTGPGHIHLRAPSANIDEPLANIFLGGEDSSFEVGYYNGSTPNVYIHSGGNTWTFDTAGTLVFPRDTGPNTTDPILNIIGGANPTITSTDASLAGPANLGISALTTTFTGFTGDAIKIYPDDGEISSTADLQIWANSGGNTEYSWTFDNAGTLTLPQGSQISETANTSVNITANANTWAFGVDGNLTVPGSLINDTSIVLSAPAIFNICTIATAGSGYNTGSSLKATTGGSGTGMTVGIGYGLSNQLTSVSVVNPGTGYVNGDVITVSEGTGGTFVITKYNVLANQTNNNTVQTDLIFANNTLTIPVDGNLVGNLIVPGSIVGSGASPAPYISGFDSIGALEFTNGNSNVTVNSNSNLWTFDSTGNLTVPGSSGGFIKTVANASIGIAAVDNGTNNPAQLISMTNAGAATSIISAYATNATIQTNATGTINTWAFDSAGNLTLPGNTFAVNYANGTQVPVGVTQDITSNGAMSIMLYDGNIKYNNYATVEPSTGNITGGNLITTGNVSAGNVSGTLLTGTLTTNAQPNITSVGTLSSLTVSGNITANNLGNISALNLNGTSQVLLGNGTFSNISVIGSSTIVVNNVTGNSSNWTGTYNSSGGRLLVTAYASGFVGSVGSYSWALRKNGSNVATGSTYWNATSSHMPLIPISYVDTSGSVGSATWSIVLGAGLNADSGDNATITITETTGITNPAFSAYNSSAVGLTTSGTKVTYTSEEFDTNNNYNTGTSIYTPTVAGYYQVTVSTMVPNTSVLVSSMIYKNGTKVADGPGGTGGGFFYGCSIASKLVYMNGTTDYLEGYAIVSSNVNTYNNAVGTYFQAYMVRGV